MSNKCTCNTSQTKTHTCFRCQTTWQSELGRHEKIAQCAEHYHMISIDSSDVQVCSPCRSEGYFVQPAFGFGALPQLQKHDAGDVQDLVE